MFRHPCARHTVLPSNRCRAGSARTRICGSQLAAEQVDEHEIAVGGAGDAHTLELVDVKRLHHEEIQRHPRSRRDLAHASFGLSSRRTTCRCARATSQPNRRESTSRCTSLRRNPQTSPRRSPPRAISSTISLSRAERPARSSATICSSVARSTAIPGSRNRCRARIRHAIRPSSPRAAAGRSRSSATSYSIDTKPAEPLPVATACTTIPRTPRSAPR